MKQLKLWLIRYLTQELWDELSGQYLKFKKSHDTYGIVEAGQLADVFAWQLTALDKLRNPKKDKK